MADETAAQHFMGIQRGLPGRLETRDIQAADFDAHLVDVVARLLFEQGVEQHALLHRRQRVDVFDVSGRHRQAVQLCLSQTGQREVGRRDTGHA
ncbi:hypothetical protein PS689_05204 [Pseudomonas fluorescens]|nr:hypothetical protein PS689_05204 [Pseudomonas fluorescens]